MPKEDSQGANPTRLPLHHVTLDAADSTNLVDASATHTRFYDAIIMAWTDSTNSVIKVALMSERADGVNPVTGVNTRK